MTTRFLLFAITSLYCLGILFLDIDTDIRVYKEAYKHGVYLSDAGFEVLQYTFKSLNVPFQSLQLLLLSTSLYVSSYLRNKYESLIYLIGPILFIGVFNSIRQSLATTLIIIAFEIYNKASKLTGIKHSIFLLMSFLTLLFALSIHKGAIFIILFYIGINLVHNLILLKVKIQHLLTAFFLIGMIFTNIGWFNVVVTRYAAYLDSSNSFDRGVISDYKLLIWWISLFYDYYFYKLKSTQSLKFKSLIIFKLALLTSLTLSTSVGLVAPELTSRILLLFSYFTFWYILRNQIVRSKFYLIIYILSPSSLGVFFVIMRSVISL